MTNAPTQDQIDAAAAVLAQAAAARHAARADKVAAVQSLVGTAGFAELLAAAQALVPTIEGDGEILPQLHAMIIGMTGLAAIA